TSGSSTPRRATTNPNAIMPRAVRIQARSVRSFACRMRRSGPLTSELERAEVVAHGGGRAARAAREAELAAQPVDLVLLLDHLLGHEVELVHALLELGAQLGRLALEGHHALREPHQLLVAQHAG